jgi:hypothetical protein
MRRFPLVFVLVCAVILMINPISVAAQPQDPPPVDTPLTGIEILVGLGALFGAKKMFDSRKKK